MAEKIRVLVVDDHPIFRDGLKTTLGTAPDLEVVGEAGDGRTGIAAFREHRPDVVLMDLRMPVMDGADAIAAILRQAPDARIIVLTPFDGDEDIHRVLRLGAKAYLLNDPFRKEILGAVRAPRASAEGYSPRGPSGDVGAPGRQRWAGPAKNIPRRVEWD